MKNKRILILSANTGEGHNSASRALQEALASRGCSCLVQDGLSFLPAWINAAICKGHVFLYRRLPGFFGFLYRRSETLSRRKKPRRRPKTLSKPCLRLQRFIEQGCFDAVVCAHVFPAQLVSRLRECGKLSIPCFFLATDYTCSPGVNRLNMSFWLIPHPGLVPEFSASGIPENSLLPIGIPVRREFQPGNNPAALRRRLNLPEDKPVAVVSCGSMGADGMARLVSAMEKSLAPDALAVVICSKNARLEQRLKKHIRSRNIRILGFVDRLSDYMEAADLYLTKPGGLSTTEAMCKGVPLLLFEAVPGVESRNLAFLTGIGCAASAKSVDDLAELANSLLKNGGMRNRLAENSRNAFPDNAAENICDILLNEKELSV